MDGWRWGKMAEIGLTSPSMLAGWLGMGGVGFAQDLDLAPPRMDGQCGWMAACVHLFP